MAEPYDTAWALMGDPKISASAKCVGFTLLLRFRNHRNGRCNPSFAAIAAKVGRKRRAVIDAVNELKRAGWLDWSGTLGGSNENTNAFSFPKLDRQGVPSTAPVQSTTPVQSSASTGAVERKGPVQWTAHELSIELSKNHDGEKRARATLLPQNFRLDDETYNLALEQLGSNEAVERSIHRFVLHHRQVDGPKAKSRDWQAKARLWIDTDAQRAGGKSGSVVDAADRLLDRIKSFDAGAGPSDKDWDGVLKLYAKTGHWTRHVDQFGGEPGSPSCKAPPALLAKHGLSKEAAA